MRTWNYVVISVALALFLEFAGLPIASSLLSYVGISTTGASIKTAAFYLAILGGSGALVGLGVGIAIGTLTRSSIENYIVLGIITGQVVLFIASFAGIISYAFTTYGSTWVSYIISLILSPLLVGFVFSLVEFFRGNN